MEQTNKSCVIYLRGSKRKILAQQEKQCREYAYKNGMSVKSLFWEKTDSTDPRKKKALRYMRAYCIYEEVLFIIAFQQKSIARNNSEFFLIKRFLKDCKAEI